ncbi:MAG TPA: DUF4416 family protein [Spirochaetota bacterium]|nr:DUF4416 family protein [Spirochaetota bacterium]
MQPSKAMLFCGLLFNDSTDRKDIFGVLEEEFGKVVLVSRPFVFTESSYYEPEMGRDLCRQFIAFDRLVETERIGDIKLRTIEIEHSRFSGSKGRNANIDPGYLTSAKVVLVTTKNFQHRIYLGRGIYGEVTLRYRRGSYGPWEWTYPDYTRAESLEFFNNLRSLYRAKRQQASHP